MRSSRVAIALVALAAACNSAQALVNPSLQPIHLFERYNAVLACRVTKTDRAARIVELGVRHVYKGTFAPKTVTAHGPGEEALEAVLSLHEGQSLVAYVGKARRRREGDILYFTGGRWYAARLEELQDLSKWLLVGDADAGKDATSDQIMFGTFNGRVDRLQEMMADMAAGRYYFPARPIAQFRKSAVGTFDKPLRGVALYDLDADGDLDIYGCCEAGDRLYIQTAPETFVDRTEAMGVGGLASVSCSFADVDAGGRADQLAGGALYRATNEGFAPSDLLPIEAGRDLLSSALVDVDSDGCPDVVVSRRGGGLAVYLDPGSPGGRFTDATERLGLLDEDQGAGGTGYFEPCDWDGDGRTDFLYAAGEGMLLLQSEDKMFEGVPLTEEEEPLFGFAEDIPGEDGPSLGAAVFAPLWRNDRFSFFLPLADANQLLVNRDGWPVDVTQHGNEIQEAAFAQLMAVAEDFTADGTVDVYVASRLAEQKCFYLMNRGYGSFMISQKYAGGKVFPPEVYNRGAWGLATDDATGDGANDLLIGGAGGKFSLLVNATLKARKPTEHPTYHERKRLRTRIVTVAVRGRTGVVEATVSLIDEGNRIVALHRIGSNVGVGCRGPDATCLAVREPGNYTLRVRFSDDNTRSWPIDLTGQKRSTIHAEHTDAKEKPGS